MFHQFLPSLTCKFFSFPVSQIGKWEIGLFLLVLSCVSSLCILDINPLLDASLVNTFSCSVGCLHFVDGLLRCAKTFYFDVAPFVCFFCLRRYSRKNIAMRNVQDFIAYVFLYEFLVSSLTFKSLIHFEFILVCGVRRWSSFIFCTRLSNFPNIIYWIDCLYPIVCSCLLCQVLIDHKGVGLFGGFLFCSIDLYMCFDTSTMVFWLLCPCSIFWCLVAWFLQLCSFSRLLWLFRIFCGSI